MYDLTTIITNLQKECDKLYEDYGLIDEVLDLQLIINTICTKNDITNPNEEKLYENFVQ